jgi:hypothetical protein
MLDVRAVCVNVLTEKQFPLSGLVLPAVLVGLKDLMVHGVSQPHLLHPRLIVESFGKAQEVGMISPMSARGLIHQVKDLVFTAHS